MRVGETGTPYWSQAVSAPAACQHCLHLRVCTLHVVSVSNSYYLLSQSPPHSLPYLLPRPPSNGLSLLNTSIVSPPSLPPLRLKMGLSWFIVIFCRLGDKEGQSHTQISLIAASGSYIGTRRDFFFSGAEGINGKQPLFVHNKK